MTWGFWKDKVSKLATLLCHCNWFVSELSFFNRFMCSVGERVWCQGGEIKANERESERESRWETETQSHVRRLNFRATNNLHISALTAVSYLKDPQETVFFIAFFQSHTLSICSYNSVVSCVNTFVNIFILFDFMTLLNSFRNFYWFIWSTTGLVIHLIRNCIENKKTESINDKAEITDC